jgi:hypothetical protein
MQEVIENNSIPNKPTGTFLKPEFQVTAVSIHRTVAVFKIAAESPDEAAKKAQHVVRESILVYPSDDLGVPEGFVDTVASTTLKESSVVGVIPALKKGGFDLRALPELVGQEGGN